jgi:uncharacterized protein (TIGR03083 family)
VASAAPARLSPRSLDLGLPEAGASPAWLAAGVGPMLATFSGADPELICWGWGGDRRARFWPRRMLFETVVHRADAAFALDVEPIVDGDVAVEGIDELLSNLPHAAYFAPGLAELRGDDETIALHATDTDATWMIRLVPAGYAWDWSNGPADVTLRGTAADLLLAIYRRGIHAGRLSARATSPCSTASWPRPALTRKGSDGVRPDRIADRDHLRPPRAGLRPGRTVTASWSGGGRGGPRSGR